MKSPRHSRGFVCLQIILDRSVDLAGTDASSAYLSPENCAVFFNSDSLDVGVPFSSGMSVRVAYIVP